MGISRNEKRRQGRLILMFRCPTCKEELNIEHKSYKCSNNHTYDISKEGYVNLHLNHKQGGDDEGMVKARSSFLEQDFYHPLREFILDLCSAFPHDTMVDAGCGEGYYTNYLQASLNNEIYAFDLSKVALQKASKANKKVHYALSSIFDLPLVSSSTNLILSMFAPIALEENHRILKEDGLLLVVCPGSNHLKELKEVVYNEVRLNEVVLLKSENFQVIDEFKLEYVIDLKDNTTIKNLFLMTPYTYKTSKEDYKKLDSINELRITCEFSIQIYSKIT